MNRGNRVTAQSEGFGRGILVVGGGISGITTALEAAEVGYRVVLIEQLPYLGGKVAMMNQYFPKLCPPWCGLEINFRRIRQNPRIQLLTSATVKKISGSEGNFYVFLEMKPEYVNHQCTACGDCEKVCPVERENDFNLGLDKSRAIFLPHEMAFPHKYVIDENVCLKDECGKCREVCKYDAINFGQSPEIIEIKVGSIVFATGWELFDVSQIPELKFGVFPDIITNLMMERMASPNGPNKGKIVKPSNGEAPKNIVFVQCAGSRDESYLSYCSGVCCSVSLKQALYLTEQDPEVNVKIFYVDLRLMGRHEDFLNRVQANPRIDLVKGKVGRIREEKETGNMICEAEDILSGIKISSVADLVVLATGMVPNVSPLEQISTDESGFVSAEKLEPGIYAAGCNKNPQEVSASLKDATGTALKAIQSAK